MWSRWRTKARSNGYRRRCRFWRIHNRRRRKEIHYMMTALADNQIAFLNEFLFCTPVGTVRIAKCTLYGSRTKRQMIAIHIAAQVKVESKGTGLEGSESSCPFIYAYLKKVAVIAFFVDCDLVLVCKSNSVHNNFYLSFFQNVHEKECRPSKLNSRKEANYGDASSKCCCVISEMTFSLICYLYYTSNF